MANEIILNQECGLCKGDGYLSATKQEWKDYQTWQDDPTEDKANSHDNFPWYLKDLPNHMTVGFFKEGVQFPCVRCHGKKVIQQILSLDDLKKLLK